MARRKTAAVLFAALLLPVGLAACGDDDDPAVDEASPSASAADDSDDETGDDGADDETGDEGAADGDLATYCEKTFEIETIGEPEVDFETASEEEIVAAAKDFGAQLQPLAAEIEAAAPAEISEEIGVLVAAVDELAETGDFETAFGGDVQEAGNTAHAFDLENCGWNVVEVSAKEYEFVGIPDELEAGEASFELSNDGSELHELVIIRKNDDTTESFEELLELPQEEAQTKTTFVGAAFGAPGEEHLYAVADLTPGEYLAVCFVPVGSVDEETEADGPPHFTQGMQHQFTVS